MSIFISRLAIWWRSTRAPKPFAQSSPEAYQGRLGRSASAMPERCYEFGERRLVHVGHCNISQVRVSPARDVVAVDRFDAPRANSRAGGVERQLGHRDKMLVVAVDERRRGDSINDGHAPADQREAFRREIDDGSADGRAVGEPRLDRVTVGGGDVERLAGDRGAGKIETRCWATSPEPDGVRSDVSPAPTQTEDSEEAAIASARLSSHARRGNGRPLRSGPPRPEAG